MCTGGRITSANTPQEQGGSAKGGFITLFPWRQPAGAAAVLGLGLASAEPHFTLVLGGGPALTLSSPSALFHVLLLFLQARLTHA